MLPPWIMYKYEYSVRLQLSVMKNACGVSGIQRVSARMHSQSANEALYGNCLSLFAGPDEEWQDEGTITFSHVGVKEAAHDCFIGLISKLLSTSVACIDGLAPLVIPFEVAPLPNTRRKSSWVCGR